MEVTKHNVQKEIESYFKSSKIRFNCTDQSNIGCVYELFVSSFPCYIQIEYDLETDDDDCIIIQFFTKMEDGQNPLYHSEWDSSINPATPIDQEIDELVEANKRLNKAVSKIHQYIDNIKDVCKEYELDHEDFVKIKYDY